MSLTSVLKEKGKFYNTIYDLLDLEVCNKVIEHHNKLMIKPVYKPVKDTDFALTGMSVIYALREYLTGKSKWRDTVAGYFDFPDYVDRPARWVVMGMMDKIVRNGNVVFNGDHQQIKLPPNYEPTIKDVNNVAMSFKKIIDSPSRFIDNCEIYINPSFSRSYFVGGADANMIIGNTLFDVRTTAKSRPLTLDNIIQQIAYRLLDSDNKYGIDKICWYYTRQECMFIHDIGLFIDKNKLQNYVNIITDEENSFYNKLNHIPSHRLFDFVRR